VILVSCTVILYRFEILIIKYMLMIIYSYLTTIKKDF